MMTHTNHGAKIAMPNLNEVPMICSWCGEMLSSCECPASLARSIDKERADAIRERNELREQLAAARREVEREAEVIAAARRFVECSVRADRTPYIRENGRHGGSPWAELVEAIGNLDRAALAAMLEPR